MRLATSIALCILIGSTSILPATEPQSPSAADLIGLWGSESSFGPKVRGELTLERQGSSWTIRVGGYEVSFPATGDELRVTLPGDNGELRVRLEKSGKSMRGFWVQPRGNLGQFASPLTLSRVRADAWRGFIEPLDDSFSLYLSISGNADGSLRGSFHNPEVNWNGRADRFRVALDGERLELIEPETGKVRFVQSYDSEQRRIGMDFGTPIALTPRSPNHAVGYFPRSPGGASYRYREPLQRKDGWRTATPREVGMDENLLIALVERLLASDPAGTNTPRIHSLLVARYGKLILEEYFYGFTAQRVHDLRSASKTFTSLMVGQLLDRDRSVTIDTSTDEVFSRGPATGERAPITIGHLLTHSSGLACDDDDNESPGNESTMQSQVGQPDWYRYVLDLPVAHAPGTVYAYCSGGINLAAGVVAAKTGAWLPDYFDRNIARPMAIERYFINVMPNGQAYGGGGIYMRPRDFLKLGQVMLNDGVWNGTRILSSAWVKESTAHHVRTSSGGSDGYGWHRYTLRAGEREYSEYEASGNGGQFVIVVPELDLAIAITAGNYNQYSLWRTFRDELVPRYVLSAVAHD